MAQPNPWVLRVLLWVLFSVVLAPVVFMVTCTGVQLAAPSLTRRAVTDPHAERFPVLVVTGAADHYQAQIVDGNEMDAFLGAHADARFTVPDGWDQRLSQQLVDAAAAERKQNGGSAPWDPQIEVRRLPGGRQSVHVNHTYDEDDVNESWYTADAKSYAPEYQRRMSSIGVGIGTGFLAGPVALAVSPVLSVAVVAWLEWRKKKKAGATAGGTS